ncbi:MAG: cell division protein FtsZ [Dysgonamonadaceae bacterium]|jgi:cell division protein FtsZ|nr:cell division protein FtsZ [Dysgonamonadaceae bacterium]
MENEELLKFAYPTEIPSIIKVIGVGGGGGNAVSHMYQEGIRDVNFALCNTDEQAMLKSPVPVKLTLGYEITHGLGAGNKPEKAREAAEASRKEIRDLLSDNTKMAFITAGMGGGTGTGAGSVVAGVAKEMGILTIGIVTIPFLFEGMKKIIQALKGVEAMEQNVDALLVINNERLREIYSDLDVPNAFAKADDTLTIAAKSISEMITIPGYINIDFADVDTTLRGGGVAIMSRGLAKGENRVKIAIDEALNSPLLSNNNVLKAKKILFHIAFGNDAPLLMEEMGEVNDFMSKFDSEIDVIWGTALDEELGDMVRVTILATGFGVENVIPLSKKEAEKIEKQLNEEEEAERIKAEEEKRKYEEYLLQKYYDKYKSKLGKPYRCDPFIFSLNNLDDRETIEAVLNYPSFNRSRSVMVTIAKKAEAKRKAGEEDAEK